MYISIYLYVWMYVWMCVSISISISTYTLYICYPRLTCLSLSRTIPAVRMDGGSPGHFLYISYTRI